MKKIGLACATLLVGLSLAGCNNIASQSHKSSSSSSSATKVVKHYATHKKHAKKQNKKRESSATSTNQSSQQSNTAQQSNSQQQSKQTATSSASSKQFNKSDPSTWHDVPYKGYPSYDAYCEANGGDPEVQAETARMQHDENVKKGIENPDGSETQNFQNWYNDEQNAWSAGNDDFPDYDQNTQW